MSEDPVQQVLCTTHSSTFVCKNIESLPSLLKVVRDSGESKIFQVTKNELPNLFDANSNMFKMFSNKLKDTTTSGAIKT